MEYLLVNPFPHLFDYVAVAPLLLRIFVAAFFLMQGFSNILKSSPSKTRYVESIGLRPAYFFITLLGVVEIISAAALLIGFQPQIASIILSLLLIGILIIKKKGGDFISQSYSFYILLLLVTLSFLVSGAGAFALTYPL